MGGFKKFGIPLLNVSAAFILQKL